MSVNIIPKLKVFFSEYREPLLIFFISRLLVGAVVFFAVGYGFGSATLAQWDARSYLKIAEDGYTFSGSYLAEGSFIAFFPLLPLLIKGVSIISGLSIYFSALLLNFLLGLAAACLLYALARDWKDRETARGAVFLLSFFPTAVFLTSPYTESLFLVLAVGALLLIRKKFFAGASMMVALALVTRLTGILLLPILLYELIQTKRKFIVILVLLVLSVVPLGMFLHYQYTQYGTPLAFMEAQKTNWHHEAVWPWVGVTNLWGYVAQDGSLAYMWRSDFFFLMLMVLTLVLSSRRLPIAWLFFGWGVVFLTIIQSYILGTSRYMLLVLPFYFFWGHVLARRPLALQLVVAVSASWMVFNTLLFILSKSIY